MKLILQIAAGVFLGSVASQFTFDAWRAHQEKVVKAAEEKLRAEEEKAREEQAKKIRALFLQNLQGNKSGPAAIPPGFVPDDAQELPQLPGAE